MLGCADEPADRVRVEGNVAAVAAKPALAGAARDRGRLGVLSAWLRGPWMSAALAQSSCGADVEGVLACLATQSSDGSFAATCARVRSNCEFAVDIELFAPGDQLVLFFCADVDGDGRCQPDEPAAPYFNFEKVGNFCNGDVIRVADVGIDFELRTCSGSPASVVADACALPDATVPPQPTATADVGETPGEPEPTLPPGVTPTPVPPATPTAPPPTATTRPNPTRTPQLPPVCVAHLLPCDPEGGLGCCLAGDECVQGFCLGAQQCVPHLDACDGNDPCCDADDVCDPDGFCCIPAVDPPADPLPCEVDADCCPGAFCDSGFCLPGG
jgi:hypothetical protein